MCGIAGIIDYKKGNHSLAVKNMIGYLRHRGPDGEGMWQSKYATLGHRRLKIMDLTDRAVQPMTNDEKSLVLVYNGELYNYLELKDQLKGKYSFKSSGDTEVLLRAYEEWGANCLEKFNGMYAFAIWDEKNKIFFAARDRFGIKPFYYSLVKNKLTFASEIKGILGAGVECEPNMNKVGAFLKWGAVDFSEATWFKNIYSLPAGHYLIYKNENISVKRYYWLPEIIDESSPVGLQVTTDRFIELISDSLRLRLQSDRKVGVHLSGGVDTTLVAVLASKLLSYNLSSFTYGYEESKYDERPYAKQVAEIISIENSDSLLKVDDLDEWLPRVVKEQDEPFTSIRTLSQHKLYSDFKDTGSTVILEAAGGEEIGAGYNGYLWPWYLDMLKTEGPMEAKKELINMISNIGMKEQIISFLLGSASNYEQAGISTADGIPYLQTNILTKEFVSEHCKEIPEHQKPFKSHLRNAQFQDLMYVKLPRFLRYVDRASMASGREARVPLLDHRIVEIGFSADLSVKIGDGHLRKYLRDSANSILSEELLQNKRSVVDPQKDWLRGPASSFVKDLFHSKSFSERGIFNTDKVNIQYKNFCDADHLSNSFGIFQLLITEMWFRYADGLRSVSRTS